MNETQELVAEVRERSGKGTARAARRQSRIPAVIYGDKKPPVMITLPVKDTSMRLHTGGFLTHVVTIDVGGEKIRAIPKDYQLDPVRDTLIHVDFLRIGEGSRLTVDIPVHFLNEEQSPGLRRGGALNIVRHTVELDVPAASIPEYLEANLSGLDIGDSVRISNIVLSEGARPTITDRDFTIATIAAPAGFTEDLNAPIEERETEVIHEADREE